MTTESLKEKINNILPYLNEKQKRIFLGAEAKSIGYGGVSKIHRLTGISRPTIHQGITELENGDSTDERVRISGGGPKPKHTQNKKLLKIIETLIEDSTRGDPMCSLKWTSESTRLISEDLYKKGYKISHETVRVILKKLGYSLQENDKSLEDSHPDRDEQFTYINEQVKKFSKDNFPVISVDTKKKELIGNYANKGQEWRKKGSPRKVNGHDFPDPKGQEVGIPYGIYDQGKNLGWVNVGCDHDTSVFAVQSIQSWWTYMGKKIYPDAKKLLICADGGGSNGYRVRLWKVKLQEFTNKSGLEITVCHFPRGTSKWNKIEHRLFSHISMNWKGRPLISHDVMINLIGGTKTKTGLKVKAKIDQKKYPIGIKVSEQEMENINITKHKFHGDWNYTISKIEACDLS
ncbi:ISAzo13 family transposase [Sulfurimonas sp. RIFOXYB12_FULL_35_9]|uniref:ISAzo13 family transposase n=1 Tax=Sulfurimonas sp. RIFOXYB12_FULL_35_9 TaxID=1802256 RepID=UPI0008BC0EE8|nr:ISAzo13 family transposase [Sulfurimonas sp. RIFOXYB12_FULL_35_9]OHE04714.1 MAG: transposase [Sulfurimonas sp. RIFOXYB12_FULL_35_9]